MDFSYDDGQNAFRSAVRDLLTRAYPDIGQRRKVTSVDPGFDEATWGQLAEMGVLGLPFPEESGGMGAGPVEVAIVAEEIGRVLAPEPFVEAVILAGGLIQAVGSPVQRSALLSGLAEGSIVPAFAHAEPAARWSARAERVTAVEEGGTWHISGVKEPVPNGARADVLVVSASVDGDTRLFVVRGDAEGINRTGYRTHDGGRAAKVEFTSAAAEPLGDARHDQVAAIERAQAEARIAYAHEAVGIMEIALNTTADYMKTRKQFGVTLTKFQALTFRAADMYVSLELARSMALWASMVQASGGGGVVRAADRVRLQTSRACRHIGKDSIQLHGAIAMTAEYGVGHYSSRLAAIDHLLGDGDWALSRLAATTIDHEIVDPLDLPASAAGAGK